MIHTSKQLKDKVRNISKGDNDVADTTVKALPLNENDAERIISEIITDTLSKIKENEAMAQMWEQFRKKKFFVGDLQ